MSNNATQLVNHIALTATVIISRLNASSTPCHACKSKGDFHQAVELLSAARLRSASSFAILIGSQAVVSTVNPPAHLR